MVPENNIENNMCMHPRGVAGKLFFFVLGGCIGAAVALLLAPKAGNELRRDIADAAAKRYDETIEAANELRERTGKYYQATREKGVEVLNLAADGASDVKRDVVETATKISGIVRKSA